MRAPQVLLLAIGLAASAAGSTVVFNGHPLSSEPRAMGPQSDDAAPAAESHVIVAGGQHDPLFATRDAVRAACGGHVPLEDLHHVPGAAAGHRAFLLALPHPEVHGRHDAVDAVHHLCPALTAAARVVAPLRPEHKLHPDLAALGGDHGEVWAGPGANTTAEVEVVVALSSAAVGTAEPSAVLLDVALRGPAHCRFGDVTAHGLRAIGGDPTTKATRTVVVTTTGAGPLQECLRSLAAAPMVRWVEHRPRFLSQNDRATKTLQSERPVVDRPLWARGLTGAGEIIGFGDTGLDFDSCFFDDPAAPGVVQYPNVAFNHRKLVSYVPCVRSDGSLEVGDAAGAHGTHVTGTAVGNVPASRNAQMSAYNGLAKDARVVFSDMTCNSGGELIPPGDVYEFYGPAYKAGARVHSNSWGNDKTAASYNAIDRRTDAFCAEHPDMLTVFAAGNSRAAGILSPASAKNVMAVGAHVNSLDAGQRGVLAPFSAMGPVYDGRFKPDVAAPGQKMHSARSDGNLHTHQCSTKTLQGTSMATPLVSASAAILRQHLLRGPDVLSPPSLLRVPSPERKESNVPRRFLPLASTLRALLTASGHHMTSVHQPAPNLGEGWGRLELEAATQPGAAFVAESPAHTAPLGTDARYDVCFTATRPATKAGDLAAEFRDVRVVLAWTDAATAAEGSTHSVINDLDLVVADPASAAVMHPNGGKARDPRNTVERVVVPLSADLTKPSTVTLRATVYAHHVAEERPFRYWLSNLEAELSKADRSAEAHDATPDVLQRRASMAAASMLHNSTGQPFSLAVVGPGLAVVDCAKAASFAGAHARCPADCSGHGTCHAGVCACEQGYRGVDCAECDPRVLCHGNGRCDSATRQCHCPSRWFDTKDPSCGTCVAGRFGPQCLGDCRCGAHGTCDHRHGTCTCHASDAQGFWAGKRCDRCAPGYVRAALHVDGTAASPPGAAECSTPSNWCAGRGAVLEVLVNGTAYVQINDDPMYANSITCRWVLRAAAAGADLTVGFAAFDIEKPYDHLYVYDGDIGDNAKLRHVASGTGTAKPKTVTIKPHAKSGIAVASVVFTSDFLGPRPGFLAVATSHVSACPPHYCHGRGTCEIVASSGAQCTACDDGFSTESRCTECVPGRRGALCNETTEVTPAPPATPVPTRATPAPPTTPAPTKPGPKDSQTPHPGLQPVPDTPSPLTPAPAADLCRSPTTRTTCGGHGKCDRSVLGVPPRCDCSSVHGGPTCDLACPITRVAHLPAALCNLRGSCADGVCRCDQTAAPAPGTPLWGPLPPGPQPGPQGRGAVPQDVLLPLRGAACQVAMGALHHLSGSSTTRHLTLNATETTADLRAWQFAVYHPLAATGQGIAGPVAIDAATPANAYRFPRRVTIVGYTTPAPAYPGADPKAKAGPLTVHVGLWAHLQHAGLLNVTVDAAAGPVAPLWSAAVPAHTTVGGSGVFCVEVAGWVGGDHDTSTALGFAAAPSTGGFAPALASVVVAAVNETLWDTEAECDDVVFARSHGTVCRVTPCAVTPRVPEMSEGSPAPGDGSASPASTSAFWRGLQTTHNGTTPTAVVVAGVGSVAGVIAGLVIAAVVYARRGRTAAETFVHVAGSPAEADAQQDEGHAMAHRGPGAADVMEEMQEVRSRGAVQAATKVVKAALARAGSAGRNGRRRLAAEDDDDDDEGDERRLVEHPEAAAAEGNDTKDEPINDFGSEPLPIGSSFDDGVMLENGEHPAVHPM